VTAEGARTAPRPDVLLVAGEASGDMHGADLVAALGRRVPGVHVRGIGGARLRAVGMEDRVLAQDHRAHCAE